MKPTKALVSASIILLILSLFSLVAYAHPGGTDSKGGHRVSTTGEYHYHHGYSAHRHYDADGDGDIDCPYDFVDKTGLNSGSPSDKIDVGDILFSLLFIFVFIGGFVFAPFYDHIKQFVKENKE